MNTKNVQLKPEFEKAILDLGFSEFTEIQEKCIPLIREGKDVIGLSHTGSGKTAAFGFPALERIIPGKGLQLLVVVPTRELCLQVAKEFRKFTKYRKTAIVEVYGGASINLQIDHLRFADAVVATPGRLLDHLERRTIDLSKVRILVLDEADKMFEMGFIDDIKQIMSCIPKHSQKLFFGATMPIEIMKLVHTYMNNPEKIKMETYVDKSKLIQHYFDVERNKKFSLLVHILKKESKGLTIVFCGTRHIVDAINRNLNKQGIVSEALHGGMSQYKRKEVMDGFRDGKIDVLCASDVAARGIDVKNVNLIINFDLPKTSEEYVHRIGRTARAGMEGKVISLLCQEDHPNFAKVVQDRALLIQKMKTPEFAPVEFSRPQRSGFGRFSRGGSPSDHRRGFSRGPSSEGRSGYSSPHQGASRGYRAPVFGRRR